MTYTKVRILNSYGLELPLYLNRVNKGWVAQILNGSFGPNREYNFTGNVVTSMSEKQIDINMRLTPAVPIPERPARYFLDYLSSKRISRVELTDPSVIVPNVNYKPNETTTYTKPTLSFGTVSPFDQSCVIRELKYNYTESPATIEFTISTKLPVMYGDTFTLYMGLGNQNWTQAKSDIISTIQSIAPQIGPVDIRELRLSLPAIGTAKYRIFNGDMDMFAALLQGNSSSNPGVFSMYGLIDGTRRFSITGGYDANAAACYAYESYPSFDIRSLISWLNNLKEPPKIPLDGTGNGYCKLEMVAARKNL
nr:MAG TPA: hypothetical protein [Caudoviricetes sp.]